MIPPSFVGSEMLPPAARYACKDAALVILASALRRAPETASSLGQDEMADRS